MYENGTLLKIYLNRFKGKTSKIWLSFTIIAINKMRIKNEDKISPNIITIFQKIKKMNKKVRFHRKQSPYINNFNGKNNE